MAKDSSSEDTLRRVHAVSITFAIGVTVALLLHIYLGVSLVSDHEHRRVLRDGGSVVDAAISATFCLGVVHPHVSGVGGGGVMLVHNIHKYETRVFNFQATAPQTLEKEMLHNVPELKAGLQMGVPGQLRGLHHANSVYGSLSWEDVVTRAAAVARKGFYAYFSLVSVKLKCFARGSIPSTPKDYSTVHSLPTKVKDGQFVEHAIQQNRDTVRRYSQQPHTGQTKPNS